MLYLINRFVWATLNSTIDLTLVINRYRVGKRVSLPCLRFKKRISSSQKLCEIVLSISTYIRVNITTQHQTKREIDLVLNQIISTVRHHPLLDFVGNWKSNFADLLTYLSLCAKNSFSSLKLLETPWLASFHWDWSKKCEKLSSGPDWHIKSCIGHSDTLGSHCLACKESHAYSKGEHR